MTDALPKMFAKLFQLVKFAFLLEKMRERTTKKIPKIINRIVASLRTTFRKGEFPFENLLIAVLSFIFTFLPLREAPHFVSPN